MNELTPCALPAWELTDWRLACPHMLQHMCEHCSGEGVMISQTAAAAPSPHVPPIRGDGPTAAVGAAAATVAQAEAVRRAAEDPSVVRKRTSLELQQDLACIDERLRQYHQVGAAAIEPHITQAGIWWDWDTLRGSL